ncbi:MAG TPA: DUF559 domain-containing protein [Bacteroidota bacterium]|nr:DUF559 domain-containing protein [Bacteroidota bacterium]
MSSSRYPVHLARQHRTKQTPAEEIFWRHIRKRKLQGLKFLRQYPTGRYIVDFCRDELNLVIELEGEIHDRPIHMEHDQSRMEE